MSSLEEIVVTKHLFERNNLTPFEKVAEIHTENPLEYEENKNFDDIAETYPMHKNRSAPDLISMKIKNHKYGHLLGSTAIPYSKFQHFLTLTYKGLNYIRRNLKIPGEDVLANKYIKLPVQEDPKKKTLILDLDETLVHAEYFGGKNKAVD